MSHPGAVLDEFTIAWNTASNSGGGVAAVALPGLLGTNNVGGNPLFKNPVGGNYRTGPGSSCFDKGLLVDWMGAAVDLDGRPRVLFSAPDIGVYEYPIRHTGVVIVVR